MTRTLCAEYLQCVTLHYEYQGYKYRVFKKWNIFPDPVDAL